MTRELNPKTPPPVYPQFKLNFNYILAGLAGLVVLVGIFTSYYTVPVESEGVVQRFGRFSQVVSPGLRFKIPFGVDKVTVIPVKRQLQLELGFDEGGRQAGQFKASSVMQAERSMVTGDLNAVQVEWVVQYEIAFPKDFLFNLRDPESTLRDFAESVMREVVGDHTVDEVLTIGRQGIEVQTMQKLEEVVKRLEIGIRVKQVQLKNVHPPGPVQDSFDEVNRAQQEREQMINQANGEYNRVVPRAKGEATQKISEAEGYAVQRVNEAEGDVTRFEALLKEYEKAPAVTRQRIYLETMAEVIPMIGGKIIIDDEAKQLLPLLNLSTPAPTPRPAVVPVPTSTTTNSPSSPTSRLVR
ncbi:FtsH protease activity modulator HflK [Phragmitibacter flavus]|uniref:Protein HflK n=1 Tax=Phragmitibacter flavus TaxID=2576071 RepID=A0A5R8KCU6_9BACT|nr:FtsH protease activity modulator HflK [Phragmitibacter flavus]TLD70130.1 FtsH protease activity modulator HflK [Phragmitibacter flavus]